MKCKVLVLVVIALLFVAGCIPTTQQVQTVTNKTDTLMVVVDKMQETFDVLVKDGVIKSEKLEALSEEIDEAQVDIIAVNEAIKEKADESVVKQLIAANQASAPFNPYAPLIDTGLKIFLGLTTLGAGGYAVKKVSDNNKSKERVVEAWEKSDTYQAEAETYKRKYQAHKQGTEKFSKKNPDKAAELYDDVGEARVRNKVT